MGAFKGGFLEGAPCRVLLKGSPLKGPIGFLQGLL